MGRRICFLVCCCMVFCLADLFGQSAGKSWKDGFRVSYVQDRQLRKHGSHLNFVRLDLEWPEQLNGSTLQPLQSHLCSRLFQTEGASLHSACQQFLEDMGTPLETVPEDGSLKTYYVTCDLKEVAYDERGYVSLRAFRYVEPKDTSERATLYQQLITYDLLNDRILTVADILSMRMLNDMELRVALMERLLYEAGISEISMENQTFSLDACLVNGGVMFGFTSGGEEGQHQELVVLPLEEISPFLTKDAKRLLRGEMKVQKKKGVKGLESSVSEESIASLPDSVKIHTAVDEMPVFSFDGQGIAPYISTRMRLPEGMQPSGRVITTFVVEKDGTLSDFSILKPISPVVDRELVRVLRNMPAWQPGKLDGQPVRVRLVVPVSLQAG